MSSGQAIAAVGALREAFDALAELSFDTLTHPELLEVLDELETVAWRAPTVGRRVIGRLAAEASPVELGAKSLREVISRRLRISSSDARRRIAEAADLGPRTAISGDPLEPVLAQTAAAQAAGTFIPATAVAPSPATAPRSTTPPPTTTRNGC